MIFKIIYLTSIKRMGRFITISMKPVHREPEQFEIDRILDSRIRRQTIQYLIRWKGYPESDVLPRGRYNEYSSNN
uniref:Chromo domain-containing protein n=1 Tax=Laticauda laticaudata TaxID=8630 RepID=A0A8C5SVB4_LATLA